LPSVALKAGHPYPARRGELERIVFYSGPRTQTLAQPQHGQVVAGAMEPPARAKHGHQSLTLFAYLAIAPRQAHRVQRVFPHARNCPLSGLSLPATLTTIPPGGENFLPFDLELHAPAWKFRDAHVEP
jgi:hypothetical protein